MLSRKRLESMQEDLSAQLRELDRCAPVSPIGVVMLRTLKAQANILRELIIHTPNREDN